MVTATIKSKMFALWEQSYNRLEKHNKKQQRHQFATKICIVRAMVFPLVMYGCESWTVKIAECWKIDAFELWCWRRLLRVPWTARRPNQSILKEISPEYSLEGLRLKLQSFGHLMQRAIKIHWKRPWCWERLKAGGEGETEDEMVGIHRRLRGHEFEQTQREISCL